MSKGFVFRFIVYGLAAVYLVFDLNVIKGPLYNWISEKRGTNYEELREDGVAALVYHQPILNSQVEFRMQEYLYVRGRSLEEVSAQEYPILFRFCMEELIVEHLMRVKAYYNAPEYTYDHARGDVEAERDQMQFSDARERDEAVSQQGYTADELSLRAHGHVAQRAYLARQINVSPEALTTSPVYEIPELRHVRHIFLNVWEKDRAEVKARLEAAVLPVIEKESTFAEVASQISEDSRSKGQGGDLGWVASTRLPAGLSEPVFAMKVGESALVESAIGWHFIEVLEVKPAHEKADSNRRNRGLSGKL